jgi:hypothetical protein
MAAGDDDETHFVCTAGEGAIDAADARRSAEL